MGQGRQRGPLLTLRPQRTFLSFQLRQMPPSERSHIVQTSLPLAVMRRRVVDWKLCLMEFQRNSNLFPFTSLGGEQRGE